MSSVVTKENINGLPLGAINSQGENITPSAGYMVIITRTTGMVERYRVSRHHINADCINLTYDDGDVTIIPINSTVNKIDIEKIRDEQ